MELEVARKPVDSWNGGGLDIRSYQTSFDLGPWSKGTGTTGRGRWMFEEHFGFDLMLRSDCRSGLRYHRQSPQVPVCTTI